VNISNLNDYGYCEINNGCHSYQTRTTSKRLSLFDKFYLAMLIDYRRYNVRGNLKKDNVYLS
jgi:hypothetical protein